jgi:hypothetical protein
MPISLQQIASPKIKLETTTGQSIAIHRRLGSILFHGRDGIFETFQREGIESDSSWRRSGKWYLPFYSSSNNDKSNTANEKQNRNDYKIISSESIEAMNAFLIVLILNGEASLLFLNASNCSLVCISDIKSIAQPICADIDQKRKELLIGFTDGSLVSFAMRLQQNINMKSDNDNSTNQDIHNDNATKNDQKTNQKIIQTILRKQANINQILGLDIEDKFSLFQIVHSNITGVSLILSLEGNICCLETSTLKYLWILKRNLFKFCPIYLWMDQFGSDFVVLCSNVTDQKNKFNDSNDSGDDQSEMQILEYWKPPRNNIDAQNGFFNRLELPITSKLNSLTIETIHPDLNVMIMTISDNDHIQLFSEDEKDGSLLIECSMYLKELQVESVIQPNMETIIQPSTIDVPKTSNIEPEDLYHNSLGLSFFINSSCSLPDCPVILLSTYYNNIDIIALHIPTLSDILNKRKCMFILASQIEIKNQPIMKMKNTKLDEFVIRNQQTNNFLMYNSDVHNPYLENIEQPRSDLNDSLLSPSKVTEAGGNGDTNEDMNDHISIGDANYIKPISIIGDIYRSALSTADNDMISMTSSMNMFSSDAMDEFALNAEMLLRNTNEKFKNEIKIENENKNENETFLMDEKFPPYDRKLDSRGGELPFGVDMDDDQVISTAEANRVKSEEDSLLTDSIDN